MIMSCSYIFIIILRRKFLFPNYIRNKILNTKYFITNLS